jgi:hypothetical protein
VLVDDDGRRRVRRLDVQDANADVRLDNELIEAIGQVDELGRLTGIQTDSREAAGASGCERVL